MEDAVKTGFTISATGEAGEKWPEYLGHYSLTEEKHNGRPVYKKDEDRYLYLYRQKDGTWAVSSIVVDIWTVMRSTTAAVSPDLCQHCWLYAGKYAGKYYPGDITVTSIYN